MESAPTDEERGRDAYMGDWRSEEDREEGEAALQPRGPRATGCAGARAGRNKRCERAEALGGSEAPKADAGAAIATLSSGEEPATTRNGEGDPEAVSRDTDGPRATSNCGLTTTVGERGPRDAPIHSTPDVQDADAPVVEISANPRAHDKLHFTLNSGCAQLQNYLALVEVVYIWSFALYPEMRSIWKGPALI
jgi:hypothetical protein